MEDAPLLKPDGALVYSGPDAFRKHYELYLQKGGALVRPEQALQPLELLDVRIVLPQGGEVEVTAQVTSLAGPLCLLHLIGLDEEVAAQLRRAAEEPSAPPAPEVSEELLREVADLVSSIPPEEPLPSQPPLPPAPPAPPPAAPPPPEPPPPAPAPPPAVAPPPPPAPAPPPEAPAAAPRAPAPSAAILLKGERAFKNPATPHDFLALPLLRPPGADQVADWPVPLVLQWLGALKAPAVSMRVKLGRSRDVQLYLLWGQELRSPTPMDTVARTLAEVSGTLDLTSAEGPKATYSASLSSVRFAVLRELLKRYSEADLATAMAARMGKAPRLNAHGMGLLRAMGLSEPQLRIGQRLLDGGRPLDVVLNNGIGVRSTWQVIYLEQLLGGLTWVDPPARENVVVEELKSLRDRIRSADHFEALGLHYTSPPRAVDRSFERLRKEYGPGSPAARQSPGLAEEIWQRVQAAHAALKTTAGRKAYRREKWPNVRMDYLARIVNTQAQLAEMRGERELALELVEAAVEMDPTADYLENMNRIKQGLARTDG